MAVISMLHVLTLKVALNVLVTTVSPVMGLTAMVSNSITQLFFRI